MSRSRALGVGPRRTLRTLLALIGALLLAVPIPAAAVSQVAPASNEVSAPVIQSSAQSVYIVQLRDAPLALYAGGVAGLAPTNPAARGAPRLDPASAASAAYLDHLTQEQASAITAITAAIGRAVTLKFSYKVAYNGVALSLTGSEAAVVEGLPQVARVVANENLETTTDNGPKWMNADEVWDGSATGTATKGELIVAGIIDTGVNSDHPSFADIGADGFDHTNPRVVRFGVCVVNILKCNDKLIGMYDFTGTGEEDDVGHGSHTASTVAGNVVDATLYAPTTTLGPRRISGVAPHANVISYKACTAVVFPQLGSCPLDALIAAIEQATVDMVDVINFSIGGGATDPWSDPLGQAFFGTQAAGVFVAASAGNSGPNPSTIGRPANSPWLLAVGASTHDRRPTGTVSVSSDAGAGPTFTGMTVASGIGPAALIDARSFGNDLCDPFTPAQATQISGRIVICTQGVIGRVAKGQNVKDSGGIGMVLISQAGAKNSVVADTHVLPAVMIGEFDGATLRTWLAGATNPRATITGTTLEESASLADRMAYFSSRGPDPTNLNVIKPDVTAPGVAIWAAFNTHSGPAGTAEYNIIQGTSMSSPHAAGAAALVRAAQPTWTPDHVKSALMSTAYLTPRGEKEVVPVTKEDHITPADPFDLGGGRIDVARAARAGLILNETVANYQAANPALGGDPKTLNLASLANPNCAVSCSWTRVVTSAAPARVRWTATTTAPAGVTLTVSPASFTLDPGQTQTLTFSATTAGLTPGLWQFGSVALAKATTSIPLPPFVPATRLPVAIRVQGGDVPPPCVIQEGVRTDPSEVNVAPQHNITEVGTSGLYPTFAGAAMPNIVFRMKVSTLEPLPPDSHWRIAFRTPGQAANLSWFVQMLRGASGDPTFAYGTLDSAAGTFTVLGAPDAGTFSADGTIKITIAASKVGNPQIGQALSAITGAAGPGVPGTVTINSDSTANGAGPTDYTLGSCPDAGPIANDDAATTTQGTPVTINVLANDSHPTNQELTVTAVTQPANGTATRNLDNTVTYTARAAFTGTDNFTYTVSDPQDRTDTATVTVTVEGPEPCPPFTATGSYADDFEPDAQAGWTVETAANGLPTSLTWDVRPDPLAHSATQSFHSDATTLDLKDDRLIAPPQDLSSVSQLIFWHRFGFESPFDGGVLEVSTNSGSSWTDVLAGGGSFAEGGYNGMISTEFNSPIAGRSAWTGPVEGAANPMTRVVVNLGAFAGDDILVRYRLGTDPLALGALPGVGWWIDDVSFTKLLEPATCENNDPIAIDDAATTTQNTPVTINVVGNDGDTDGDSITVTAVTQPAHGTVVNNGNGTVTYTPTTGYTGPDSFTYTISDGRGGTDTASVAITVTSAGNSPPNANDDSATTQENQAITINVIANDTDPDNDPLMVTGFSDPPNGSVVNNGDGTVTYTPDAVYSGPDSFTYTISDGRGGADTANVAVTVTEAPNQAPDAVNDQASTMQNTSIRINVLANDTDPDNDALSVTGVTDPPHGTAVNNADGTVTYTPDAGYTGTDTFDYTVSDGHGGTDTATVTVFVNPPSDTAKVNGGGWIENGSARSNFSFNAQVTNAIAKGKIGYNRENGGISLKGTVDSLRISGPAAGSPVASGSVADFSGSCTLASGATCSYTAHVEDRAEPGTGWDIFSIRVFDVSGTLIHEASGVLAGGNIQIH